MNKSTLHGFSRREFLAGTSTLGAAALLGLPRTATAEPPPETKKIRLVISGACGRMGTGIAVGAHIGEFKDLYEIAGLIEHSAHPRIGKPLLELDVSNIMVTANMRTALLKADLLIEFTTPEATVQNALIAAETKIPMVIGTTGLSEEQFSQLRLLSKHIPIFWSPNMSLGVYIVRKMTQLLGLYLKKFNFEPSDVKIEETHHIGKKDKPSGTAKQLAEDIAKISRCFNKFDFHRLKKRRGGGRTSFCCCQS
jgi:4-hydroxy-tetrahydrodipicolinate reductase